MIYFFDRRFIYISISILIPFLFVIKSNFEFSISPTQYVEAKFSKEIFVVKTNNEFEFKDWIINNTQKNDLFLYIDNDSPKSSNGASYIALMERNLYFNFKKGSSYSPEKLNVWATKYYNIKKIINEKNFEKFSDLEIKYLIVNNEYLKNNFLYFKNFRSEYTHEYFKVFKMKN